MSILMSITGIGRWAHYEVCLGLISLCWSYHDALLFTMLSTTWDIWDHMFQFKVAQLFFWICTDLQSHNFIWCSNNLSWDYMHAYTHIHTYIHAYIHIYILCKYIFWHTYWFIYFYMYIYTLICWHTYFDLHILRIDLYMFICICIYIYTLICWYTYFDLHIFTYTYRLIILISFDMHHIFCVFYI